MLDEIGVSRLMVVWYPPSAPDFNKGLRSGRGVGVGRSLHGCPNCVCRAGGILEKK